MTLDLQSFAVELATETKSYVRQAIDAAVGDLRAELLSVKAELARVREVAHVAGPAGEAGPVGPAGRDGKDADVLQLKADLSAEMQAAMRESVRGELAAMLREMVREEVGRAITTVTFPIPRDGRDGKDVDVLAVKALVEAAVAALPLPKDGRDGKDGAPGRDGLDGKDGAPGMNGKDGRDGVDGKDGAQGLAGKDGRDGIDGKDGAPGLNGKDGASLVGALIDREEHLILTLSDGSTKDVGHVVGKSVEPLDVAHAVESILATWERPKDGKDGMDGKDGLGFDDLAVDFDESHGYSVRFSRGTEVKTFRVAWPWYAGTWQSGRKYPQGAKVTKKGAEWTAKVDTFAIPGESKDWQMSAKGGRDGKDAPGNGHAE